jgi:hypothetical protein
VTEHAGTCSGQSTGVRRHAAHPERCPCGARSRTSECARPAPRGRFPAGPPGRRKDGTGAPRSGCRPARGGRHQVESFGQMSATRAFGGMGWPLRQHGTRRFSTGANRGGSQCLPFSPCGRSQPGAPGRRLKALPSARLTDMWQEATSADASLRLRPVRSSQGTSECGSVQRLGRSVGLRPPSTAALSAEGRTDRSGRERDGSGRSGVVSEGCTLSGSRRAAEVRCRPTRVWWRTGSATGSRPVVAARGVMGRSAG